VAFALCYLGTLAFAAFVFWVKTRPAPRSDAERLVRQVDELAGKVDTLMLEKGFSAKK
jgi:hypothetical protein